MTSNASSRAGCDERSPRTPGRAAAAVGVKPALEAPSRAGAQPGLPDSPPGPEPEAHSGGCGGGGWGGGGCGG
jgi:hypothetical protein